MSRSKLSGRETYVIETYLSNQKTVQAIADELGVSNVTVYNLLKTHGIPRRNMSDAKRVYTLDQTFFEKIDNEEKAYTLGLLYADGCNTGTGFHLTLKDQEIVEATAKMIGSNQPVRQRGPYSMITVSSKKMSDDLIALGCPPRKTFQIEFPTGGIVPTQLTNHFVRGYFDGDGCIHRRGNNLVVHVLGTQHLLEGIASLFPFRTTVRKRSNSEIWYLGITRTAHVEQFGDWLYDGCTVALTRKRVKFNRVSV